MKKWYCIIQGRDDDNFFWKQIIKDIVHADTKKEARNAVFENYLIDLPMRIKRSDIEIGKYLLSIYEIPETGNYSFINGFFEIRKCEECGKEFRIVDLFNITGFQYGDFCSSDCKEKNIRDNFQYSDFNVSAPVIYKITQISTGKVYIGQTVRSFTLRWWEHIKSTDGDKFHLALKENPIEDFTFQVIEKLKDKSDLDKRERYWINYYKSVSNGFNSVGENNEESMELFGDNE